MKKIYKYSLLLLLSVVFSCNNEEGYDDLNLDKSAVLEMSGDWYVQASVEGELVADYFLMTTSNTATNDGTDIQITDKFNFWGYNFASPVNVSDLTFTGSNLASSIDDDGEPYDITVTVTNGLVEKNATTTSSGRTSDKISYDIEFSDDPGTIYHIEGYKRSGFLEDEH